MDETERDADSSRLGSAGLIAERIDEKLPDCRESDVYLERWRLDFLVIGAQATAAGLVLRPRNFFHMWKDMGPLEEIVRYYGANAFGEASASIGEPWLRGTRSTARLMCSTWYRVSTRTALSWKCSRSAIPEPRQLLALTSATETSSLAPDHDAPVTISECFFVSLVETVIRTMAPRSNAHATREGRG